MRDPGSGALAGSVCSSLPPGGQYSAGQPPQPPSAPLGHPCPPHAAAPCPCPPACPPAASLLCRPACPAAPCCPLLPCCCPCALLPCACCVWPARAPASCPGEMPREPRAPPRPRSAATAARFRRGRRSHTSRPARGCARAGGREHTAAQQAPRSAASRYASTWTCWRRRKAKVVEGQIPWTWWRVAARAGGAKLGRAAKLAGLGQTRISAEPNHTWEDGGKKKRSWAERSRASCATGDGGGLPQTQTR